MQNRAFGQNTLIVRSNPSDFCLAYFPAFINPAVMPQASSPAGQSRSHVKIRLTQSWGFVARDKTLQRTIRVF